MIKPKTETLKAALSVFQIHTKRKLHDILELVGMNRIGGNG